MAFSWAALLATAESALSTVAADAAPIIQAGEALGPVVSLIPGAAPIVTAVEAGAAAITAIAPTAVADAASAFASVKKIIDDGSPVLTQLETLFDQIFHLNTVPGGVVVLSSKTSAATAPAASLSTSLVINPPTNTGIVPPPGTAKS